MNRGRSTVIYFVARRVVTFKEATDCFIEGFKAMVPALLILTLALTVAAVSFVCFLLAGFIQNWVVCLAIGLVLTVALAIVLSRTVRKKVAA